MPKDEWGVKRVCPNCSTRFYDLQMNPMTCPSCGATFTVEALSESKPRILRPEKAKAPVESVAEDVPDIADNDEDPVIEADDDIDDDLLEDDDDNVSLEEIADVGKDEDDE
jgi:uncharacterized protein (TIGR02300 family)